MDQKNNNGSFSNPKSCVDLDDNETSSNIIIQ